MGKATIDFVTEQRCREIANEMIPNMINIVKVEAYKEIWKELRNMCDAPHWCVWLSELDNFFERELGVEDFNNIIDN